VTNTVSKTVSDETLNAIITIESGGRLNAKAPTSSALGLGQFLNGTWMAVVRKHRPDLLKGRSEAQVLALRTDPQLAVELLARFTEDNQHIVGMNCTGGDLYLAHFLGAGAAQKLFHANPDAAVEPLVGQAAVAANVSILRGRTCAQVRAWSAKRMHDSAGHDWVAKYYKPPAPVEPLIEDPPPAAEPEETAEDIPDPQDAPAAPAVERRDPVPPVTPAPAPPAQTPITPEAKEGFLDWIKRKGKTITSWVGGGGTGLGVVSYLTDWRVAAVIVCGLIIAGTIAGGFYLVMRKR
jgi:hypothetical protein